MKSLTRIILTVALLATIIVPVYFQLIEIHKEIRAINRNTFATMDLGLRNLHYAKPHKEKVQQCRECQQEGHEYLKIIEKKYPETFLD
jgi:hypothetical protein